jgi:uncharacterized protein YqgC (DUF456 family)
MDYLILTLNALLCITGLGLSLLGFSGTWMVLLASLISKFSLGFPSIGTLIVFALLCVAAEALEAAAGFFGVQKRGGSKRAGLAATAGGLIGAAIGSAIFPIIGTMIGLLTGSFALAFLVEWNRLKHHGQAAQIATGALMARLGIVFLKTILTLLMIGGLYFSSVNFASSLHL